jgi:predicted house-cleaning noncanonical NTP pyrophosphatase (MazG superfamily)
MWTPPKLQKEEALEKMQTQYDKIDQQMVNQRYIQTSQQQKEMFLGRMQSHMQRLGGRFEQQDAMTKQEFRDYKFDEVDKILDTIPKQYEEQRTTKRAAGSRSNSVSKMSPEAVPSFGLAAPLAEVTKSQELDQMADLLARVPRMDAQTAQSSKVLQVREQSSKVVLNPPKEERIEVTKSQELDQVADLLARVPRMDAQAAQSSKVLQVREQSSKVVLNPPNEERKEVTKSQELDQVADLLARVPRINDQSASSRKMLQVQSGGSHLVPAAVDVTLSQELDQISNKLDKGRMDNQSAVMTSNPQGFEKRSEADSRRAILEALPVAQTSLPTIHVEKKSDNSSQEPVPC